MADTDNKIFNGKDLKTLSTAIKQALNTKQDILSNSEDISIDITNNKLKLSDKSYDTTTFSGLGRKYLRKNIVSNKNVLTQAMIADANTIYHIQYDYDLGGETITIPAGCTLKFEGGSLKNGTLVGNNTSVQTALVNTFNCTLQGHWNFQEIYVEWFGAKGDGVTDDADSIQHALDASLWRTNEASGVTSVILQENRTYAIGKSLNINPFTSFGGQAMNDKEISPKIKGLVDNLKLINLKKYLTNPSRINIHNLSLSGSSSNDRGSGISTNESSLGNIVIDTVYFTNLLNGVDFEMSNSSTIDHLVLRGIGTSQSVGIPININSSGFVYGVLIEDCAFKNTKIGGIRLLSGNGQTIPNVIRNCSFDHCGTNYNLDDYNEYGSSAIYLKSDYGITEITNCYFETNCPLKKDDNPIETKHGFVEAKSSTGYTYITNPNVDKTAEIVFNGSHNANLIISGSHFSYNYACVHINGGGNLTFTKNEVMVPGITAYGIDDNFPFCRGLVRIKDLNNNCNSISLFIEQCGVQRAYNAVWGDLIKDAVIAVDGTNILYLTAHVDMPSINQNFDTSFNGERLQFKIYLGSGWSGANGGTIPYSPVTLLRATSIIKNFIAEARALEVVFVLTQDITISGYDPIYLPSCKYRFTSFGSPKKISLAREIQFFNSELVFNNVIVEKAQATSRITLYNSAAVFYACELRTTVSNRAYGILNTYGNSQVSVEYGSITIAQGQAIQPFIVKSGGNLVTHISPTTTNVSSLPFDTDADRSSGATLPTNMRDITGFIGNMFFFTTPKLPVFWSGTGFIDASGTTIDSAVTAIKGTSAVRTAMTLTSLHEGLEFYDTTLKKKVLWNGSAWVNLDGSALS